MERSQCVEASSLAIGTKSLRAEVEIVGQRAGLLILVGRIPGFRTRAFHGIGNNCTVIH